MFITFEGGEGSGKTTLMQKLEMALQEKGYEVVATRAPGGTSLGKHVRELVLSPDLGVSIGRRAELMLYLADRAQLLEEVISPALENGKVVLCDRFNDSSAAYQGVARGIGLDEVQDLCDRVCQGVSPDITFFLDIDPVIGFSRITEKHDRLEQEKMNFHQQVRQAFHTISQNEPERFYVIDATLSPDEVFAAALKVIEKKLHEISL
jgi:dTMP kinase